MDFYLRAVPVPPKNEFLDQGRDSLHFHVFPWHFYFMGGHSLVELAEHDNGAADIMADSMYIYVLLHYS